MQISVIVPIHNALSDVKLCLESLIKNLDFNTATVILADDFSDDKTRNYLRSFVKVNPHIELLLNKSNLGFIKTANIGLKHKKANIYVLLNSDTIIPSKFCEKITKCFKSDADIGIASPIASNSATHCIGRLKNYSVDEMNRLLEEKHNAYYPAIPNGEGFCFCIRNEVVKQQGYLDEVFGLGYHEEVDYSFRAVSNNWKCVLIDNLYVYHKSLASFGKTKRNELVNENKKVFLERWGSFERNIVPWKKTKKIISEIRKKLYDKKVFSTVKFETHRRINILGIKFTYRTQ